jgi:hypothetical protein
MIPGKRYNIAIYPEKALLLAEINRRLCIRSLTGT